MMPESGTKEDLKAAGRNPEWPYQSYEEVYGSKPKETLLKRVWGWMRHKVGGEWVEF